MEGLKQIKGDRILSTLNDAGFYTQKWHFQAEVLCVWSEGLTGELLTYLTAFSPCCNLNNCVSVAMSRSLETLSVVLG